MLMMWQVCQLWILLWLKMSAFIILVIFLISYAFDSSSTLYLPLCDAALIFTAWHTCIAQTMPWQDVCPSVWRPWTTLTHNFKVTPFFDAENLRNRTRYRQCFNGILIGTVLTGLPVGGTGRPWKIRPTRETLESQRQHNK